MLHALRPTYTLGSRKAEAGGRRGKKAKQPAPEPLSATGRLLLGGALPPDSSDSEDEEVRRLRLKGEEGAGRFRPRGVPAVLPWEAAGGGGDGDGDGDGGGGGGGGGGGDQASDT